MAQEEDFIDLHLATENVEHVEECTAAPSCRIRGIIKSQILADTNQTETSDSDDRGSSRSPPPNCAICLGKCENKCFTDSCLHQFCFACLMEWSKVRMNYKYQIVINKLLFYFGNSRLKPNVPYVNNISNQ